jgi:DDE superfamily endonuclease
MDETGLFWKLQPDRSLATKQTSGGKKSKDRITVALCTNGDGSEKLHPWIIGRSKNPRCFKHVNRKNLRIIYCYNKSKWMTGIICEEWLQWFDRLMAGRKVLLLLDNFSGHELGVEKVGGLDGLRNVKIRWLPPNTTSHWQPLDQGIIASFKLHYRRQWVEYIVRMLNSDKDPNKTVTLLKAIQWTRVAWNDCVTSSTILRCYWKSTVIEKPANAIMVDEGIAEREDLRLQISLLPGIEDPLSVDEFIEPLAEQVIDEDIDIMEAIVAIYGHDENEDEEEVEGELEEPLPLLTDAIEALSTLQRFELSRDDGSRSIQALDQLSREFSVLMVNKKTQKRIDSFFSAN